MTQQSDGAQDDTTQDEDALAGTAGPTQAPEPGTERPAATPEKDPKDWTTGDEPMTGPQRSYLGTLAREAGEDVPEDLTKARASEMIDRLQERTGRGT